MKFYKCPICGNVITIIDGNQNTLRCCNHTMEELITNTMDAAVEKHVPIYEIHGKELFVRVGEVEHPSTEEHYISFLAQVVGEKVFIVKLAPGMKPEATFPYVKNANIYAYCNLHGLWLKEVK